MYFLDDGAVEMWNADMTLLYRVCRDGDFFGYLPMLTRERQTVNCKVTKLSELWSLSRSDLEAICKESPHLQELMQQEAMKVLASQLAKELERDEDEAMLSDGSDEKPLAHSTAEADLSEESVRRLLRGASTSSMMRKSLSGSRRASRCSASTTNSEARSAAVEAMKRGLVRIRADQTLATMVKQAEDDEAGALLGEERSMRSNSWTVLAGRMGDSADAKSPICRLRSMGSGLADAVASARSHHSLTNGSTARNSSATVDDGDDGDDSNGHEVHEYVHEEGEMAAITIEGDADKQAASESATSNRAHTSKGHAARLLQQTSSLSWKETLTKLAQPRAGAQAQPLALPCPTASSVGDADGAARLHALEADVKRLLENQAEMLRNQAEMLALLRQTSSRSEGPAASS